MGLIKLNSSKFQNVKEEFSNKKEAEAKIEAEAKNLLEWTNYIMNFMFMQSFMLTYTTFTLLLRASSLTKSVELFNRLSGDHLNVLNQQIEYEKLIMEDNNSSQRDETEEWKMSKLQIAEASKKSYLNLPIKHAKMIKALESASIFTNPFATIARKMFKVDKNDIFQSRRTLARLIQKNGIVNNFLIEIIDWYDNHSFPAVIMLCSIGMFVCVFITFLLSFIAPVTSFLLSSIIFLGKPVRSMILVTCSIIVFILLIILWIFLWPVALALAFGSIFNVPLWFYRILFFHFKELFCEVERGGYIRNPMLLPFANRIGQGFNYIFDWLAFIIKGIGAGSAFEKLIGMKLEKIEIKNERAILRKVCKILGGVYDIIWEYIIVAGLIYIQMLLLCIVIFLKFLSIVNPVSFVTRLKNGTPLVIPGFKLGGKKIWPKTKLKIKWHVPHTFLVKPAIIQSFLQYLTVESWANSFMEYVNEISLYDRKIFKVNKKFMKPIIKKIKSIVGIDLKIKFKRPPNN